MDLKRRVPRSQFDPKMSFNFKSLEVGEKIMKSHRGVDDEGDDDDDDDDDDDKDVM